MNSIFFFTFLFSPQVARLVKCWNSTIICNQFLFGRSYTFELLAIQAGRQEEEIKLKTGRKTSILNAFRMFLQMVENIEEQRIVFDYSEDFYSEYDTPDHVLEQTPLILDPSNPYNNVMNSFPPLARQLFRECAKETLERLEALEDEFKKGLKPHLKEIFRPQLTPSLGTVFVPHRWLIGVQSEETLLQPRLTLRNTALSKETKSVIAEFHKAFSAYLYVLDVESDYKMPGDRQVLAKLSIKTSIDYVLR